MDDAAGDRRAWIGRVLGFAIPETTAGSEQPPTERKAGISPRIAFTQSRLAWDGTRKQVHDELQRLENSVLEDCADEPDFATISANSKILYTILDFLDERLLDKLDEALNAADPAERVARQNEAREIIDEYIDYMAADELLHDIDDSGFVELKIQETVAAQLAVISNNLKALAA